MNKTMFQEFIKASAKVKRGKFYFAWNGQIYSAVKGYLNSINLVGRNNPLTMLLISLKIK